MEQIDPTAPTRQTFRWAFRPFWIMVALSAFLLAWEYDRRHAPETILSAKVYVEGERPVRGFAVKVDGVSHDVELPVPIGWRTLEFSAQDANSFETNIFVWYGPRSLGNMDLARSRGKLRFDVSPRPNRYTLRRRNDRFACPTGFFSNIPAGEYVAGFEYSDGLSRNMEVRVTGNAETPISLTNSIGSVELSGAPDGGEFVLKDASGDKRWTGRFPFVVPHLRSGEYRLTATREDYRIDRRLLVEPGQTNHTLIEFVFGGLEVTSEPVGATVYIGRNEVGITPVSVEHRIPGVYSVEVRKDGFDPLTLAVTVEGTNVAKAYAVLVNTRYRIAMSEYAEARRAGRYQMAVRALAEALVAQPNDVQATALFPGMRAAAFREEAMEHIDRGDLDKAMAMLAESDKIEPESDDAKRLRAKIAGIRETKERERIEAERRKADQERERAESNFRDALDSAQRALGSGNLQRAREYVAEARKWKSSDPAIVALEAEISSAQAKQDAAIAAQRLREQIERRRRELDSAMDGVARADENQPVASLVWRTTKSARQVQFACEPKDGKGMKMYDSTSHDDYLVTWRSGSTIPLLGVGTYVRFGVATLGPDLTEIRLRVYSLVFGEGKPAPDRSEKRNQAIVDSLYKTLTAALGGDLRNP